MEELDLRELFSIFWNRKLQIIAIVIVFTIIGFLYSYFYVVPEYTAVTSLLLVQNSTTSTQTGESAITATDLTMNSKLVSTYIDILKRNAVLEKVADNLEISHDQINDIRNRISVGTVNETEVIEIKVKHEDPEYAAKLANEVAKVFCEKIAEIYKLSNTYVLDEAEVPANPSNVNHIKDIVLFAFIGAVISIVCVLIINLLDNTVKTEQDIEKCTGLFVLTSIPDYEEEFKIKKGGKKK